MNSDDLWTENEVLRSKLFELQKRYETEREERLKLKAENLWIKRLLHQDMEKSAAERVPQKWVI